MLIGLTYGLILHNFEVLRQIHSTAFISWAFIQHLAWHSYLCYANVWNIEKIQNMTFKVIVLWMTTLRFTFSTGHESVICDSFDRMFWQQGTTGLCSLLTSGFLSQRGTNSLSRTFTFSVPLRWKSFQPPADLCCDY